ncbi:MAG TPA: hydroxymethylbilane synthase, partial [Holophaga sp.]|nr:hydroxymethylbilane synthase [Holophaga sp.]
MKIVVGTRKSALALQQAEPIVAYLRQAGHEVTCVGFTTRGDAWQAGPLDKRSGTGFFTRELEEALASGGVDLLVHSFKDVALERPEGFVTACVPPREDPADWLVLRPGAPLHPVIATSSERRLRFLRHAFPESPFTWIRGNVPTRLQRLREGELRGEPFHATVLAAAGVRRLGLDLSDLEVRPLPFDILLPAPGQGTVLAETRADRQDVVEALQGFHHPLTVRCVGLERAVLAGIGGGCQQPLGVFAEELPDGSFRLQAA